MMGYIVGPLFLGPLSEIYGRRPLLLITFGMFVCFTLGTALAPTWYGFLIFRFLAGVTASAPLTVVGGLYADILPSPVWRGRTMAAFSAGTTLGPALAPLISGFLGTISWRWPFWFQLIFAGATAIPVAFLPETFAPVLLMKRAARLRKETGSNKIIAPVELEDQSLKHTFAIILTRPAKLFIYEEIVSLISLYLAFVYSVLYLFFEAYPIIFQGIYHMTPGISGLAFLPIGVGAFVTTFIVFWWDSQIHAKQVKNPQYHLTPEYRRLSLACFGGPMLVIGLFWLAWTASPSVHWMAPIFAGLPFGIGMTTIFMSLLNYLTDAYGIYSASVIAANSCLRSISAALLPLAAKPMYNTLGVHWATSLLGFFALAMCVIPIAFMRYGAAIRAKSKFCMSLADAHAGFGRDHEKGGDQQDDENEV